MSLAEVEFSLYQVKKLLKIDFWNGRNLASKEFTFVRVTGLQTGEQRLGGGVFVHAGEVIRSRERGHVVVHVQHSERDVRAAEEPACVRRLGDEFVGGRHLSVQPGGRTQLALEAENKHTNKPKRREKLSISDVSAFMK